ncbi:autotransporter outer membrane beta-barrel domain-containing protein [Arundinibacter roseus]|uniref:TMF family protein n=1 Tax=Arundinibacter roseus TaxID=2070510 RepID=A0A4R4KI64_9BACT|nr:hypothetical protein [Arundinibacter roseus]TDB67830.1 hypothetical protein EZE20_02590 [Arundinibacter roseus]
MKSNFTFLLLLLAVSFGAVAQNQITTPAGQPLVIGNQGVRLSNLNSSTPTQAANGKVLTVDANGLLFLAPDEGGTPSQWTNNAANIFFNTGNVGLGTNTPLQRLHVNGDINIPSANAIRINNLPFLRAPGTANTIIGNYAGSVLSSGAYNVFIGSYAGESNTTANFNVFLGTYAGQKTTSGTNNFFAGVNSGKLNTTGQSNTFIGSGAGSSNTTGSLNTFIGPNAGASNTTASLNFFCGVSSGYDNTTGVRNLFLGYNSGRNSQTGNDNILLGANSGQGLISGGENIFIGYNSKPSGINAATLSNSIAIGTNSTVTISNAMILGTSATNIGIGNNAPTSRLHVTLGGTTSTGVRFENLPNVSGTVYPLFVDSNGNILKSNTSSARESASPIDNNWRIDADNNLQNLNSGSVVIGDKLERIPKGYKLVVSDGLLTEKVKVAVKNTSEWSDYVFNTNYKLMDLNEVKNYIEENKHLPDVPSAKEMVKQGNDLHRTDALLLRKIEELTLYLLEIKDENKELKNRIIDLEKRGNNP